MKFKLLLLFIILPFILHSQWTVEKDKDAWGDTVGKTFISSKINSGGVISWKNRPRIVNVGLGSYNYEVKILSNKIIIWSTDMPSWNRKEKADSKYIKIKFDNQPEIKILANRVQGSQVDIYSNLSTLKKNMKNYNTMILYYLVNTKKYEVIIDLKGFTKASNLL